MSRKVSKIDDKNHPGHGFYAVEGVNGHFDKHTAERVAGQMSTEDEQQPHTKRGNAPTSATTSKDGSVACPSCGHRFKASPAGEASQTPSDEDEPDNSSQA